MALSDAEVKTKVCSRCKREKNFSEFTTDKRTKDGKDYYCKECKKIRAKIVHDKNPEKVNNYAKKWRERNREKFLANQKANNKKNAEYRRNWDYVKDFGITIEDYDVMYIQQGGRCAICGIHQSKFDKRLSVDHCHKTGIIRGLLCQRCNVGLGCFGENVEILKNTIKYLEMVGD